MYIKLAWQTNPFDSFYCDFTHSQVWLQTQVYNNKRQLNSVIKDYETLFPKPLHISHRTNPNLQLLYGLIPTHHEDEINLISSM